MAQVMVEELRVGLAERSYPIWIGQSLFARLPEALAAVRFPKRVALVTNPKVRDLYGALVEKVLAANRYRVSLIVIPDGEQYKNAQTLESIYDALIEGRFDRSSGLIALGGGVVGDIAGYAAATYLRGIPFVQVPTTLLAQVDSSVGGKTAVNHRLGKNLIGAFYQPQYVHIDVGTLATLPSREFAAGMAEVIKYGVIRDRGFFDWLIEAGNDLRRLQPEALVHAVMRSCQIKANVVELDEKESSLRAILNYGHTFGHAVETLAGYGEYRHGEAVAIGMSVAALVSCNAGLCSRDEAVTIIRLLQSFDLPVKPPSFGLDAYLDAMGRDKKVKEGLLRFVLNRGVGDCLIREISNPEPVFASALEQLRLL